MEPSSGIECILSLKFPTLQKFQMPTVTNCFKLCFDYLPPIEKFHYNKT